MSKHQQCDPRRLPLEWLNYEDVVNPTLNEWELLHVAEGGDDSLRTMGAIAELIGADPTAAVAGLETAPRAQVERRVCAGMPGALWWKLLCLVGAVHPRPSPVPGSGDGSRDFGVVLCRNSGDSGDQEVWEGPSVWGLFGGTPTYPPNRRERWLYAWGGVILSSSTEDLSLLSPRAIWMITSERGWQLRPAIARKLEGKASASVDLARVLSSPQATCRSLVSVIASLRRAPGSKIAKGSLDMLVGVSVLPTMALTRVLSGPQHSQGTDRPDWSQYIGFALLHHQVQAALLYTWKAAARSPSQSYGQVLKAIEAADKAAEAERGFQYRLLRELKKALEESNQNEWNETWEAWSDGLYRRLAHALMSERGRKLADSTAYGQFMDLCFERMTRPSADTLLTLCSPSDES